MPKSAKPAAAPAGESLEGFTLPDLQPFTYEKAYTPNASKDVHLYYVGRDDVHGLIVYLLSRVTKSLYLNMYSYDDADLNNIIMEKVADPDIKVVITLDKSQTVNKTEKMLLASDTAKNPSAYNTDFVIGNSATGQISHTKGFVADGIVAAEGSTNWSKSGEGIFTQSGSPGGPGYKAQNNTQSVITDPDTIASFTAELIREHEAAQQNAAKDNTMFSSRRRAAAAPPRSAPKTRARARG